MDVIKSIIKNHPYVKQLIEERNQLLKETFVPPGHFYSPIPSIDEIKKKENQIWGRMPEKIEGVDLNTKGQLKLFKELTEFYKDLPFQAEKVSGLRYYFDNPAYSYSDAIFLFCMVRKLKPKRVIEIGSGYSSCVMMDTNQLFFENEMKISFIEPYPDLLFSLMTEQDKERYEITAKNLQEVSPEQFDVLGKNDILFIDSTHVSKIGSDVNYIFFEILPRLKNGVYIHFHDILYPFEYPKDWVFGGRSWNENYLLRAFLQYNNSFKIRMFNSYLEHFYQETLEKNMPLISNNKGGSIWLEKIG